MSIGLHILFIYSIICFLKASIILNMKVVPNDNFKFGGERVNECCCYFSMLNDLWRTFNIVWVTRRLTWLQTTRGILNVRLLSKSIYFLQERVNQGLTLTLLTFMVLWTSLSSAQSMNNCANESDVHLYRLNSFCLVFIDVWTPIWSCTMQGIHVNFVHCQIGVYTSMNTEQKEFTI